MFEIRKQIPDRLRAGKDGSAEFTTVGFAEQGDLSPGPEEFAGESARFANAERGVVFLGVDDSGAVHEIPPDEVGFGREHWLLGVAARNCDISLASNRPRRAGRSSSAIVRPCASR